MSAYSDIYSCVYMTGPCADSLQAGMLAGNIELWCVQAGLLTSVNAGTGGGYSSSSAKTSSTTTKTTTSSKTSTGSTTRFVIFRVTVLSFP
jgi:hypothetical protein